MSVSIISANGKITLGKNLALFTAHARRHGVKKIVLERSQSPNHEALIKIGYKNEAVGLAHFFSYRMAEEWATLKMNRWDCPLEKG